ncbi:MAG: hypothetical protein JW795_14150 [Chitinivibrionales bacterium]|nr:hypothetical protein [Chitinivibrionales bacterium]
MIGIEGADKRILDGGNDTGSLCGIHTGVDSTTLISGLIFRNAKVEGT